jgi:hypothetical protein
LATAYKLTQIEHAITIAKTLRWHWFRGQSRSYNELTPAVYREEYKTKKYADYWFYRNFKLRSHGSSYSKDSLPEYNEFVDWLMLMQHHGTPTRLLDWTTSILVALYFAVSSDRSFDAELWAIDPAELNSLSKLPRNILWNDKRVILIAGMPQPQKDDKTKEEFFNSVRMDEPKYPIAFIPPNNIPRMISQMSRFTLHPRPERGCTIPELLHDKKQLVRYIIPSDKKDNLLDDLSSLGINRHILYGDLDALGQSLKEEIYYYDKEYEQQDPPIFNGE